MGVLLYFFIFALFFVCLDINTKSSRQNLSYTNFAFTTGRFTFSLLLPIVIYVVIRTISYNTGIDYLSYYNHYVTRVHHHIDLWGEGREIGYRTLVDILSSYFDSPNAFFLLCAILSMGSLLAVSLKFGKAAKYIALGWTLYMFNLSMNLYRQYISLSLLMFALYWVLNNKFDRKRLIYAYICIAIAYFFHHSSLVGVVMLSLIYVLRTRFLDKRLLIGALLVTTVSSMTVLRGLVDILGAYSDAYMAVNDRAYLATEMLEDMYETGKLAYVNMLCNAAIIWYGHRVLMNDVRLRYFYYVLAICLIITPITNQEILMRMRLYLTNFMIIGYGLTLYLNRKYYNFKSNMILLCVVIYQIAYCFFYQNSLLMQSFPLKLVI